MAETEVRHPASLHPGMIAPCGMNCGVCSRAFRAKDRCNGCRSDDDVKPKYCGTCRIRNCNEMRLRRRRFCFECAEYPCPRLRRLDARYRTRYRMSVVENLDRIQELGVGRFVDMEMRRWKCRRCHALTCVHKEHCIYCGQRRSCAAAQQGDEAGEA